MDLTTRGKSFHRINYRGSTDRYNSSAQAVVFLAMAWAVPYCQNCQILQSAQERINGTKQKLRSAMGVMGMRSEAEVIHAVEVYGDMIRRVCFYHLKNRADTEDVFQNVFLKYMLYEEVFESREHEKAWLLRVAINACKDYLKSFFRKNTVSLEMLKEIEAEVPEDYREVLEAVLTLPDHYKNVIYLFYYEGYSASEIGKILGKKENTIYSMMSRGRGMLREKLLAISSSDCAFVSQLPDHKAEKLPKSGGEGIDGSNKRSF